MSKSTQTKAAEAAKAVDNKEAKTTEDVKPSAEQKEYTKVERKHEKESLKQVPHLKAKIESRQAAIATRDELHRTNFAAAPEGNKLNVSDQQHPGGARFGSVNAETGLPGYENQTNEPEDSELLDAVLSPRDQAALLQSYATGSAEDIQKAVRVIQKNSPAVSEPQTERVEITKEVSVNANAHAEDR